jgi:hypothetical protein
MMYALANNINQFMPVLRSFAASRYFLTSPNRARSRHATGPLNSDNKFNNTAKLSCMKMGDIEFERYHRAALIEWTRKRNEEGGTNET